MDEKEREKQRMAKLRDKYRSSVCSGCRNNYYNYQHAGNGIDAPTTGDGCFHLDRVTRGKCPLKS